MHHPFRTYGTAFVFGGAAFGAAEVGVGIVVVFGEFGEEEVDIEVGSISGMC